MRQPNVTSEISFRATWQSKPRHPVFIVSDQVSEPVETELFLDTVYGDAVDDDAKHCRVNPSNIPSGSE